MKIEDFINTCVDEGYAWRKGEHQGKDGYFVGCERLDTTAHFTPQAIENNDWPTLRSQIIQGKDVRQVTRIVGYFSRVGNWNKSKLGELKDRHAGDYRVNSSASGGRINSAA